MIFFVAIIFSCDGSSKNYNLSSVQGCVSNNFDPERKEIFCNAYSDFISKSTVIDNSIPKIIHFVWVGGKLPYIYNFCIESWQRHHPGWQIILWDDRKIDSLEMQNRTLFNALSNNGAKADVARYEILKQFGGFYIDVDFFCLKPIDFFAERATLFLGGFLEDYVGNGIIGACKNNEFINLVINDLHSIDIKEVANMNANKIMDSVGPIFITKKLCSYLKTRSSCNDVIILPSSYLHSFPNTHRDDFWNYKKSLVDIVKEHVYPETLAVHLWSVSWVSRRIDKHTNTAFFCQALDIAGPEFTGLDSVREVDGATALHVVSAKGSANHVKSLLLAGMDINAFDKQNNTPLVYAIKAGNINNIKLLLSYGADTVLANSLQEDPESLIKKSGNRLLLRILNKKHTFINRVGDPALIESVRANDLDVVESLLRHGYKVDICDKNGRTPLFYAAQNNNLDIARLLILHGANLNQVDNNNQKISDIASQEFANIIINQELSHKIAVVICSYNNSKYYQKNLLALFNQTYDNWECYYIDDNSQDNTFELAQEFTEKMGMSHKVHFIKNEQNLGAMANQYNIISWLEDRAIVVIYDGDDRFYGNDVLSHIDETYRDQSVWLTYGTYVPEKEPCEIYCKETFYKNKGDKSFFRKSPWMFSHLRTFYAGLFKKIKLEDLMYDGDFVKFAPDVAAMLPMLEMAANNHYRYISKKMYIYNNCNSICEFRVDSQAVTRVDKAIREKPAYEALDDIYL